MKSLLIVGAGSFSPEVDEMAELLGYEGIAFLDDDPESAFSSPVIGTMKDIKKMRSRYDTAIVALGNNENRIKYHNELKRCGYSIPILVHPTAYVSPEADLSPGCIVRAKAVVSRFAKISEACILNMGVLVDHHVEVGEGCHILMGAVLKNRVKVEPLSRVECLTVVQ